MPPGAPPLGRALPALLLASVLTMATACRGGGGGAAPSSTASPTGTGSAASTAGTAPSVAPGRTDAAANATVSAYFESFDFDLSATEAACIAAAIPADNYPSIENAVAYGTDVSDEARLSVFRAITDCAPQAYVDSQVEQIVSEAGATEDQATCVVHASLDVLRQHPELLTLAAGETPTAQWPEEAKSVLRTAIGTCVPSAMADTIVAG
jgi:hypothetical protein